MFYFEQTVRGSTSSPDTGLESISKTSSKCRDIYNNSFPVNQQNPLKGFILFQKKKKKISEIIFYTWNSCRASSYKSGIVWKIMCALGRRWQILFCCKFVRMVKIWNKRDLFKRRLLIKKVDRSSTELRRRFVFRLSAPLFYNLCTDYGHGYCYFFFFYKLEHFEVCFGNEKNRPVAGIRLFLTTTNDNYYQWRAREFSIEWRREHVVNDNDYNRRIL